MRLSRTSEGITLDQSSTIEKILRKLNYFDSKLVSTPYDSNMHLNKNVGELISQLKYS